MATGRVLRHVTGLLGARGGLAWTFLWVSGARACMLGFSLLGSVVIYRTLAAGSTNMVQAGQFAIGMAIVRVLINSIGSTGDLVVLRRVPVLYRINADAAADVMRAALLLRLVTFVLIVVAALLLRGWFADRFLHGRDNASLVALISASAAGELLLRSVIAYFQATEQFGRFVTFEAAFQGGRLAMVIALAATGSLTVSTALGSYAAMGLIAAILAGGKLPRGVFTSRPIPWHVLRDAAHFFVWTVFAFGLAAGTERTDLFLLGRFRNAAEVGLYGGVLTLAIIPDFISGMLATVLQPRVVRLRELGELPAFNRRFMLAMLLPGLLALLLVVATGHTIVTVILGPKFAAGVPVFILLAAGSVISLMLTPVSAVLISMTAPRMTTALTSLQLLLLLGGGVLLIPKYGPSGAAGLFAGTRIILSLAVAVIGTRRMHRLVAVETPTTG